MSFAKLARGQVKLSGLLAVYYHYDAFSPNREFGRAENIAEPLLELENKRENGVVASVHPSFASVTPFQVMSETRSLADIPTESSFSPMSLGFMFNSAHHRSPWKPSPRTVTVFQLFDTLARVCNLF